MLQLTPQSRIFLAVQPVDFRKGIDGLAALCRNLLHENPLGGTVYVFRNRTGTTLKLLAYDGQGFWLCTNYLSSYYTSFSARRGFCCLAVCRAAARSARRSQRLQCFSGKFGSGTS